MTNDFFWDQKVDQAVNNERGVGFSAVLSTNDAYDWLWISIVLGTIANLDHGDIYVAIWGSHCLELDKFVSYDEEGRQILLASFRKEKGKQSRFDILTRFITEQLEMLDVCLHLGIGVRHRISYVDLITRVHKCIIESHGPIGALLLRIQIIDFFLVARDLVCYIFTAFLNPSSLSFFKISIHFGAPNWRFHSLQTSKKLLVLDFFN